ncbi:bifunctional 3-phenylpropionate/cinnamic acid dioxygenase ferredoxin subunit [Diaphorobacter sp. HDW4A]|uniref:3-phenylpropionate/cinnamic acid dioxygenase ferredoxin subunit n=1 Tax=Diaphorobacter sp. HDW4A TaxID=2714924 RepID=UPI00140A4A88|nr:3-phenylpropionate/cinnamic acid dioxygenase ferredoxin subunit [Diaphorobacter sp. HDW4A]QIL78852.1 bifunctional 3-phenylpropionate/cinnamic acid dioxygenase ferredoxin subunit [Diaphorobacter sp. HDW4A]
MTNTVVACEVGAVDEGGALKIDVNGLEIALFHIGGEYFAVDDRCSHGNASMSEGYVEDDGTVECPLHAARFCVRTGVPLCQPATDAIRTYPVTLVDGKVCLTLEVTT